VEQRRTILPVAPALIAHGGAGGRGPDSERLERRRGMLAAVGAGSEVLRAGGSALDAVIATVRVLEDHPLFNAGVGSLLTIEGTVEMDASVMEAPAVRRPRSRAELRAGAVAGISRVRNPVLLARAVMELTPHVLMAGAGAERLARRAGVARCRAEDLVTQRARERWRATLERRAAAATAALGGSGSSEIGGNTVGAVALDAAGGLAAATSTGGVSGKLPGRIDLLAKLLGAPLSEGVEVLQGESERVHPVMAGGTHGVFPVGGHCFAQGRHVRSILRFRFLERGNVRWRRRRGSVEDVIEDPFSALHG